MDGALEVRDREAFNSLFGILYISFALWFYFWVLSTPFSGFLQDGVPWLLQVHSFQLPFRDSAASPMLPIPSARSLSTPFSGFFSDCTASWMAAKALTNFQLPFRDSSWRRLGKSTERDFQLPFRDSQPSSLSSFSRAP